MASSLLENRAIWRRERKKGFSAPEEKFFYECGGKVLPSDSRCAVYAMIGAASIGGAIVHSNYMKSPEELKAVTKQDGTVLTVTDGESQDAIISYLNKSLRGTWSEGVSFLAEEKRKYPYDSNAKDVFIIDPIDGTKNFSIGLPLSAIAIAHSVRDRSGALTVRETVTLQPELKLWTISSDAGTFQIDENRNLVRKNDLSKVENSGVVILWGDIKDKKDGPVIASMMESLGSKGYEVRMIGSCVLANAYVSAGVADGLIIYSGNKIYAHPWDVASHHQVIKAGGIVTSMDGVEDLLNKDPHSEIAAKNEKVYEELLGCVQKAKKQYGVRVIQHERPSAMSKAPVNEGPRTLQ